MKASVYTLTYDRKLGDMDAREHFNSDNIVTRITLPAMRWSVDDKVEVCHAANRGVLDLEPRIDRQEKYLDFINYYLPLTPAEQQEYIRRYPEENATMTGMFARKMEEGLQQGRQEGQQLGQQHLLARQLQRRFGPLDASTTSRLKSASTAELEHWADNILTASSLEEVFQAPPMQ